MRVRDILAAKPQRLITISPEATISRALKIMSNEGIGALLVFDELRRLVGLFSERDAITAIAKYREVALTMHVHEAMSDRLLFVCAEAPVLDVMRIMTQARVRHLPVMDGPNLAGIVSIGDVLKSRLAEKDLEIAVLRDVAGARSSAILSV